jgi:hypothetical protein
VQLAGQLRQSRKTLCNRAFWCLATAAPDENGTLVTLREVAGLQLQYGFPATKSLLQRRIRQQGKFRDV